MSDAIAFLRRAIEQGQGLAEADLVLKGGRIFDLVSGELVQSDVAICSDRIVGTMGEYRGRREIDVRGKVIVPGFHRHPLSCRILAHNAARIRPLRASSRGHDVDLRSARDRQCARPRWSALFSRCVDADRDGPARAAFELRSGDGARDLGRPTRGRRSSATRRSSQSAWPRRIHELSRRSCA